MNECIDISMTVIPLFILVDKTYISGVNVHLQREYADNTLESCRKVSVPSSGGFALNFMCPTNALVCTTDQFFHFMGHNLYSPFPMDFILISANETDKNGFVPPEMPAYPCWEAPDVSFSFRELLCCRSLIYNF